MARSTIITAILFVMVFASVNLFAEEAKDMGINDDAEMEQQFEQLKKRTAQLKEQLKQQRLQRTANKFVQIIMVESFPVVVILVGSIIALVRIRSWYTVMLSLGAALVLLEGLGIGITSYVMLKGHLSAQAYGTWALYLVWCKLIGWCTFLVGFLALAILFERKTT